MDKYLGDPTRRPCRQVFHCLRHYRMEVIEYESDALMASIALWKKV